MTYEQFFCLVFNRINYPGIAVTNQSNAIASHTINIFLARIIPYSCPLTSLYFYWKCLMKSRDIQIFFAHVLLITVQLSCFSAEDSGAATLPDPIIASSTPLSRASVQAKTFFSIPNPILGIIAFASSKVMWGTRPPSKIRPSTFVRKITLLAPTPAAKCAAALSPSTFKKSNSSLSATGETTGRNPLLTSAFGKDESTAYILPVKPPSIVILLPFLFKITSFFLRLALIKLPSTPEIPAAFIPCCENNLTIALFIFPDITIV